MLRIKENVYKYLLPNLLEIQRRSFCWFLHLLIRSIFAKNRLRQRNPFGPKILKIRADLACFDRFKMFFFFRRMHAMCGSLSTQRSSAVLRREVRSYETPGDYFGEIALLLEGRPRSAMK